MARRAQAPNEKNKPKKVNVLRKHLAGRIDPLTSAILVFPIFITYQVGILTNRGHNGVDFVTSALIELSKQNLGNYLLALAGMLLAYAAVLVILRKQGSFSTRSFIPIIIESTFYAGTMGSLILFVIGKFIAVMPRLAIGGTNPLDVIVISAGAGFHEELIFRAIGMNILGFLLAGLTGKKRAWIAALILSSLLFSLAHHLGSQGEPFTFMAFIYRTLAGMFFALIYQIRGFAVVVWTHTLYDIYVLSLT